MKKFRNSVVRNVRNLRGVTSPQRSQRGEDVSTICPQIFAAFVYADDFQELVKLPLVTSIVREKVYRVCIEGYISVVWKTAPVT